MLVDRPCRGRQSQNRASGAKTIDTDVGHTSHGPTRKLALSEPPSNASAEINAAWCDLVCGAETGLNRRAAARDRVRSQIVQCNVEPAGNKQHSRPNLICKGSLLSTPRESDHANQNHAGFDSRCHRMCMCCPCWRQRHPRQPLHIHCSVLHAAG